MRVWFYTWYRFLDASINNTTILGWEFETRNRWNKGPSIVVGTTTPFSIMRCGEIRICLVHILRLPKFVIFFFQTCLRLGICLVASQTLPSFCATSVAKRNFCGGQKGRHTCAKELASIWVYDRWGRGLWKCGTPQLWLKTKHLPRKVKLG